MFKVVGKEKVTVPAGEFDAFKVEGQGQMTQGARLTFNYWIAPDKVRRPLITEFNSVGPKTGTVFANERFELQAYRQLREIK